MKGKFNLAEEQQNRILLFASLALILVSVNVFYLRGTRYYTLGLFLAVLALFGPLAFSRYKKHRELIAADMAFPDFLNDVVDGLRGGMTLPMAIKSASKNDYSVLNPQIRKLVSQISWGVPFEKAFETFAESIDSKATKRAISTIIEAHRSGGDVAEILAAVNKSTRESDKVRKERYSRVYTEMVTGYVVYFVFIGAIIAMQKFLLPSFSATNAFPGVVSPSSAAGGNIFMHLVLIQGFFAGIIIGKLANGSFSAGLKHSLIMCSVGILALTFI